MSVERDTTMDTASCASKLGSSSSATLPTTRVLGLEKHSAPSQRTRKPKDSRPRATRPSAEEPRHAAKPKESYLSSATSFSPV
eukprot:2004396-Prorocentrum_lima.AAC.1